MLIMKNEYLLGVPSSFHVLAEGLELVPAVQLLHVVKDGLEEVSVLLERHVTFP